MLIQSDQMMCEKPSRERERKRLFLSPLDTIFSSSRDIIANAIFRDFWVTLYEVVPLGARFSRNVLHVFQIGLLLCTL